MKTISLPELKQYYPKTRTLWIWMFTLGSILILTVVWFICYSIVYETIAIATQIEPTIADSATKTILLNIWEWFPLLYAFGMILVALVYSQKREAESVLYG